MKSGFSTQNRCPSRDKNNFCLIHLKRIGFVFKTYLTICSRNLYAKNLLEKKKNINEILIRYKRIGE